jgi:hypothetical protein
MVLNEISDVAWNPHDSEAYMFIGANTMNGIALQCCNILPIQSAFLSIYEM